jgi:molecular chaperone GrpE (heat shock protein)
MTLSPRELSSQNTKLQRDQEKLIQDLLGILDDLDNACEHWQQATQNYVDLSIDSLLVADYVPHDRSTARRPLWQQLWQLLPRPLRRLWRRLWNQFFGSPPAPVNVAAPQTNPDLEVVASASEGVEMIRRSLLDVLRRQQVVPMEVLGKTFDPSTMYAMGRQECADEEENTVVQEVVRGYMWQNRILRESQVLVSVRPVSSDNAAE